MVNGGIHRFIVCPRHITPEPYLGEVVKPATGTTNSRGYASLTVAVDDLPEALKRCGIKVGGVYRGTYKITLSNPRRKMPDSDSKGLPLGEEIARDTVDSSVKIMLPNQ